MLCPEITVSGESPTSNVRAPRQSTATKLLEVAGLRKSFEGTAAVDGITFHVEAGEVLGLLGPNGAGKTTTMTMIAGLLKPDAGTIAIAGTPFEGNSHRIKRLLGVVPQDLAIYPEMTAWENIAFFGSLYGVRGNELRTRIEAALNRAGLLSCANKKVATFSGGMKRRLNFAIALVHAPRLLILDEPTVGVDPQSRSHLLDCIRQLRDDGLGIVYASHYMEEVEAICDRVAIIDRGRMLTCGPLTELLSELTTDVCLRISPPSKDLFSQLGEVAMVESLTQTRATLVVSRNGQTSSDDFQQRLLRTLSLLEECGTQLLSLETNEPSLERLFLSLTGHGLRD